MQYLFFDTETTSPYQTKARLVQLAYLLTDEYAKPLDTFVEIIRPEGFIIENDHIHGITHKMARSEGIELQEALISFMSVLRRADKIVAHHIEFDKKIIFNELKATQLTKQYFTDLYAKPAHCIMQESMAFCGLKKEGTDLLKYPKLSELHEILFQKGLPKEKSAYFDAQATMRCFFELKKRCVIP